MAGGISNTTALRTFLTSAFGDKVGTALQSDKIKFVTDEEMDGAGASFNDDTGEVKISQSMAQDAIDSMKLLQEQGILDAAGKVKDGKETALKQSKDGAAALFLGTVVQHEMTHAEQHGNGSEQKIAELAQKVFDGDWGPDTDPGPYKRELVDAAVLAAKLDTANFDGNKEKGTKVLSYMLNEYEAYAEMERTIADTPALRDSEDFVHVVTDESGNALNAQQAMENLFATFKGEALKHGPDAGKKAALEAAGSVTDAQAAGGEDDHPWRRFRI